MHESYSGVYRWYAVYGRIRNVLCPATLTVLGYSCVDYLLHTQVVRGVVMLFYLCLMYIAFETLYSVFNVTKDMNAMKINPLGAALVFVLVFPCKFALGLAVAYVWSVING